MSKEADLIQRAYRLDGQALAEIYDTYSDAIYRYAMRLLGDVDTAEECVSETFTRFLNALHRKKGPREYLQAYLFRIAHNWITDYYRRAAPDTQPIDDGLALGNSFAYVMYNISSLISPPSTPKFDEPNAGSP